MVNHVNGFKLEVTVEDGLPHVVIALKNGTVVMDTKDVSVFGLQNLSAVLKSASSMALRGFEDYSRRSL
jgi:hypothetical protein